MTNPPNEMTRSVQKTARPISLNRFFFFTSTIDYEICVCWFLWKQTSLVMSYVCFKLLLWLILRKNCNTCHILGHGSNFREKIVWYFHFYYWFRWCFILDLFIKRINYIPFKIVQKHILNKHFFKAEFLLSIFGLNYIKNEQRILKFDYCFIWSHLYE
jgi:hypothetical protein